MPAFKRTNGLNIITAASLLLNVVWLLGLLRRAWASRKRRRLQGDFGASMQTATALCINTGNRSTVWNIGINNATFAIPPSLEVAKAKLDRGIWLRTQADLRLFEVVMLSYARSGKQLQIKCKVFYEGVEFEPLNCTNHHITLFDGCRRITDNEFQALPCITGTSISIADFFSKKANVFQTAALVCLPHELMLDFEAWVLLHKASWVDSTNGGTTLHISL